VKNADTAEQKGYDAGKKVSGIKRHIIVDTQGFPHAVHVTTADVTDRSGAIAAITQHQDALERTETILADGNYTGENFATAVRDLINAETQIAKRNALHTFAVMPKRWIVERSFGWLDKARRLWKNCERKLNTSLNMTVLAFLAVILRRL
jgi:transposase